MQCSLMWCSIYMEMQDSARERRAAHAGDWMRGGVVSNCDLKDTITWNYNEDWNVELSDKNRMSSF